VTVDAISAFTASLSSIVLVEIELGSIFSPKVTATVVLTATPEDPLPGVTATTVGGVVSGTTVVKEAVKVLANAIPARFLTRGSVAPPNTRTV
jgi:hypothetical protein